MNWLFGKLTEVLFYNAPLLLYTVMLRLMSMCPVTSLLYTVMLRLMSMCPVTSLSMLTAWLH